MFYLLRGGHAGSKWRVFAELSMAEAYASKHYTSLPSRKYEIVVVREVTP